MAAYIVPKLSGVLVVFASSVLCGPILSDLVTRPSRLLCPGSLVTSGWDAVPCLIAANVAAVFSNAGAFAALKADGCLVSWGNPSFGGDGSAVASSIAANVTTVFGTPYAFAALNDGSLVTWGDPSHGGDSTAVAHAIAANVTTVFSTYCAFAALKNDDSLVTWGCWDGGGHSSAVASQIAANVTTVYSNLYAFAALRNDGSIVTWGSSGNSSAVASYISANVSTVYSNDLAFAALKSDGSLVTWGDSDYGGDSSVVACEIAANVTAVVGTSGAFAALKGDGSVVTWGSASAGANSSEVARAIAANVTTIFRTGSAFAALKHDGSLVTWGDPLSGGDSSTVARAIAANVTTVFSTLSAFAALKDDGSLVVWGRGVSDGNPKWTPVVASQLFANVTTVYSNLDEFAALKDDGSLVSWPVERLPATGVTTIVSTWHNFAVVKGQCGSSAATMTLCEPTTTTMPPPTSGTTTTTTTLAVTVTSHASVATIVIASLAALASFGACVAIVCVCRHRRVAAYPKQHADGEIRDQPVVFYFLDAAYLRKDETNAPLPSFQKMVAIGVVEPRTMLIGDLFDGNYKEDHCAVSHRWETPAAPDPMGNQKALLREFLLLHPRIKYVWNDFWCLPQGKRTKHEKALFRDTLQNINYLYLTLQVVIISDLMYMSRFWTSFEAWLAMRTASASESGLEPATAENRRYTILINGAAAVNPDPEAAAIGAMHLEKLWLNCSLKKATDMLNQDDIYVTNGRDKTEQLQKMAELPKKIKHIFLPQQEGQA